MSQRQEAAEVRFRQYGEFICLIPLGIIGYICVVLYKCNVPEGYIDALWFTVALFSLLMIGCDIDWKLGVFILIAIGAIWSVSELGGFSLVRWVQQYITHVRPHVSPGGMLLISHFILIVSLIIIARQHMTRIEISANQFEVWEAGSSDISAKMEQIELVKRTPNFFKLLFFGMGDIVVKIDGKTIHTIHDIPFLSWGIWRRIEHKRREIDVVLSQH